MKPTQNEKTAAPSASPEAGNPYPQSLRDLVSTNLELKIESFFPAHDQELQNEMSSEMEILKGHLSLLESMTQKNSFMVREVKYLLKA